MEPQYIGTWRITKMETWDADDINLTGPGHLKIDREGGGCMQFGAVEAALDCRMEDRDAGQRLGHSHRMRDDGAWQQPF